MNIHRLLDSNGHSFLFTYELIVRDGDEILNIYEEESEGALIGSEFQHLKVLDFIEGQIGFLPKSILINKISQEIIVLNNKE